VLGQVCAGACLAPKELGAVVVDPNPRFQRPTKPGFPAPDASEWATVSELLEDASPTYTEPWDDVTCRTLGRDPRPDPARPTA
jgi:hypothetical protein